ncbi:MAG: hypothetical protein A3H27_16915 [Acidobacteria bacterium RIFCSPLOWO2_02_FULL_59_13]|nr:MAG: hypothetical protein A3H27_16915 [Acidobacteria bacterium RIFCSPLOWO2_02_FULL_59_13]
MAEMPMGGAMAMDERHLELKVVSLETGKAVTNYRPCGGEQRTRDVPHEAKPPQKMLFPL